MDKIKSARNYIIIGVVVVACFAVLFLISILRQYGDFDVKRTIKQNNAAQTSYLDFQQNLLGYNRDGVSYTDYEGNLIWTDAYEMEDPSFDECNDYLMIYDKSGTQIEIMTMSGKKGSIHTNLPITCASLADNGTVAVLTQEGDTHYLTVYNVNGDTLASGELHTTNTGYPISLAISSDAKKLMVSLVSLNDGDVKTTLLFYNFGRAGEKAKDNIVATYSYSNMIIPRVDFVNGDRAIAFGDNEIVLFSSSSKPKVSKEIFVKDRIVNIFHNDKYFGLITTTADTKEATRETMTVYTVRGFKRFSKEINASYNKTSFTSNNEILLTDGENVTLYTLGGIKKFSHDFKDGIYQMIPWDGSTNYIFIQKGVIEKVKLK